MKPSNFFQWGEWISSLISSAVILTTFTTGILLIEPVAWAGGTVTTPTEASLRAAMTGGGTVTFAFDGTITLGNTITVADDTVLDGGGHQVTISGNNTVRVFYVNTNVSFTAINLTIANGRIQYDNYHGAGIFNDGGTLNLQGVVLQSNTALGDGGGVFNQAGTVSATNCVFWGNTASNYGFCGCSQYSRGGAVRNEVGVLNLQNCSFNNNTVSGTTTFYPIWGNGTDGFGGAIHNNGTLHANACAFVDNVAIGGPGANDPVYSAGGNGAGGAIYNLAVAVIEGSTFSGNLAAGATGGSYPGAYYGNGSPGGSGGRGSGGAIYNLGKVEARMNSFFTNRVLGGVGGAGGGGGIVIDTAGPGGQGGAGGNAEGAVLFNANVGVAGLVNCTIAENTMSGGSAGNGGTGGSGLRASGNGGNGGNGGSGFGCVYDANGLISITNCTVALNSAQSGAGGSAGAGGPAGHLGYPGGPGVAGTNGTANGGLKTVGTTLLNTLLSANTPMNCSGSVTDAGHNLSSDASCAFTHVGSLNNTDPKLSPLADNGGPTLTMALLPGSPAIDAGSSIGAPSTDQRGITRPQGPGVDIGAFEYQSVPMFSSAGFQTPTSFRLQMSGLLPEQTYTLQTSSNLVNWSDLATCVADTNGACEYVDCDQGNYKARFYRLKSSNP